MARLLRYTDFLCNPWAVIILILCYNFGIRIDFVGKISYLNEDSALILGVSKSYDWRHPLTLFQHFYTSYGPNIIRPFQLIGLYIEKSLLDAGITVSLAIGITLFCFGLLIIWKALAFRLNYLTAYFSVILISSSAATSEPLLWSSDRHDIYLLVFAATSFWIALRHDLILKYPSFMMVSLSLSLWGGFLSNEKGVAIPFIISTLFLFFCYTKNKCNIPVKTSMMGISISLINLFFYFIFRYYVLGVFIGGYDNRVLPDNTDFYDIALFIFRSFSTTVYLQGSKNILSFVSITVVIAGLFIFSIRVIIMDYAESKAKNEYIINKINFLMALTCIVLISAAPTFRWFIWENGFNNVVRYDGLNYRYFWLSHLAISIIFGCIYGYLILQKKSKRITGFLIFLFVIQITVGVIETRVAGGNFVRASEYTLKAMAEVAKICECVNNRTKGQGLSPLRYGVNVFTEDEWLASHLLLSGHPQCLSLEATCQFIIIEKSNDILLAYPQ